MATFIPNKYNPKERSNYGVRVARPGFDASTCAQNQLLFNSGWAIMQIAEVVDFRNQPAQYLYIMTTNTTVYDSATGTYNFSEESEEVSSAPSGYNSENDFETSFFHDVLVNKRYVLKSAGATYHIYYYPAEQTTVGTVTTTVSKRCSRYSVYKKAHGLDFVPFFAKSEWLSGVSNCVLLFNIDIRRDVDYPYTEEALPLISKTGDYGIKSESIFGDNVPGLCSNMFSKLVQAVKTEETVQGDRDMGGGASDTRAIWSPVNTDDPNEVPAGAFLDYEIYAFVEDKYFSVPDDGGEYYREQPVQYMSGSFGGAAQDAWAVTTSSFQSMMEDKNSLVALRKPMVSPSYEEITV